LGLNGGPGKKREKKEQCAEVKKLAFEKLHAESFLRGDTGNRAMAGPVLVKSGEDRRADCKN
jgi:hypothetical protein